MKLLLLSFYYKPDLSAGSFRTTALLEALLDESPDNLEVDIITTLPNRYNSFNDDALRVERDGAATIHRIALPEHNSGMLDQSRAFITYARSVIKLTKKTDYDLVYATSSRLMTAALGALVSVLRGSRLYLDIRDIFVDTMKDVLPKKLTWLLMPCFSLIERLAVRRAVNINVVSAGFLPYFRKRYSDKKYTTYTNGIDEEFMPRVGSATAVPDTLDSPEGIVRVVYAGNMGEGQGLHNIVPSLALVLGDKVKFTLIGDGGRRGNLVTEVEKSAVENVEILSPVKRSELIEIYKSADVLFLHLNDYDAFRKVLPSKLFEYAALGKPILAGVAGYAADFVHENIANAAVFPPCDVGAAVSAFSELEIKPIARDSFVEQFYRKKIMHEMAASVLSEAGDTP